MLEGTDQSVEEDSEHALRGKGKLLLFFQSISFSSGPNQIVLSELDAQSLDEQTLFADRVKKNV